jgi:hypothetical protein
VKAPPSRPIHGIYHIREEGRKVGWEEWKMFSEGDAIIIRSRIVREGPPPYQENLRLALDPSWGYRSLVIILQGEEGKGRTYEGSAQGARWRARVTTTEGGLERWEFAWDAKRELDYRTPLFNGLTIKRLDLGIGESAEVDTIFMEPETYAPREVGQRYTRQQDDHLEVAAGRFHAPRYAYESPCSGATGEVWTDLRDTVLRFDEWFELVKYEEE